MHIVPSKIQNHISQQQKTTYKTKVLYIFNTRFLNYNIVNRILTCSQI
jgi:hypothetical protein